MPRLCKRKLKIRSNSNVPFASLQALLLAAALVIPVIGTNAQQPQIAVPKKTKSTTTKAPPKPDVVPDGPPMVLDAVVKMLERVKAGTMAEARVIAFINKRGLDFIATPGNLAMLKDAGASAELADLVTSLKPPPVVVPVAPPKPVTGVLQFSCAPAECTIRLDGGPDRATKNGKLTIDGLAYRQYTVDFRKEGFTPRSERINVAGETQPEIKVALEVLPETRAEWGRELYKATLQAIGGKAGLAELKTMSGSGAASSWDTGGAQSEWNIKSTFSGQNYSYVLNSVSSGSFTLSCQGETCGQKGRAKKMSVPEAAALNTNLVQYNRFHLVAMLERISNENHRLLSGAPPTPGGPEQHLIVDSRDETYDIALDGTFLPVSVSYRSKDGLASVKVTYAQYATFEKSGSKYPRHTSVALPGEKQHGIQVRYEGLTASSK
jgi:hypothetical protein